MASVDPADGVSARLDAHIAEVATTLLGESKAPISKQAAIFLFKERTSK